MTRPDLDALEALLAKATPGKAIIEVNPAYMADVIRADVNALPGMISYVRELERRVNEGSVIHDRTIALAMRERCARACDELASVEGIAQRCAAAIRGIEA